MVILDNIFILHEVKYQKVREAVIYTVRKRLQDRQLLISNSSDKKKNTEIRIKSEKRFGLREGHLILCGNCGCKVTSSENNITVKGEYIHTFTNPAGITYQISCFSTVEGCIIHSIQSHEFTWFEGFSWSHVLCSRCLVHLGWYYQRRKESFYGLILDHLVDVKIH